ncbi:MAG: sulfite exporter TauE/SafE family protein [Planctomycetota bacterium]
MMTDLTTSQYASLALGAMGIGFSKAGFPGISMLHVVLYAMVFGTAKSTGILLPMLIVGDICAIVGFGRRADTQQIRRLLPPTVLGVVAGALLMNRLDEHSFRLIVGAIILTLSAIQGYRMLRPDWLTEIPRPGLLALALGLMAGLTTMMANAAGPVVALYLLAVRLPKMELIGTVAWLFFVINVFKVPLSYSLGLINASTLQLGACFAIFIPVGLLAGRWLVSRVPQQLFNAILLGFTVIAALRFIGLL